MSTVWNSWQDTWTGRPVETEEKVGTYRTRGGGWRVMAKKKSQLLNKYHKQEQVLERCNTETIRTSIGDRVVSVAFVLLLEVEQYLLVQQD